MQRISRLATLLVAAALAPVGIAHGQFLSPEGGYAQLLAQHDRNGNGLLEDHERAAMLAVAENEEPLPLSAFPLICEGQSTGFGGAAATADDAEESPPPQVARHVRLRGEQLAENQPPGDADPVQDEQAPTDGYAPAAPSAPPQVVRIRNAVQYRMLLNESQAQPRSEPFARAATFGPMVGRAKQYPRHYFAMTATAHVGCSCTRASLYLAGY